MFDFIEGKLHTRNSNDNTLTITANSIGYSVLTTPKTKREVSFNTPITLYVSLIHKEDSMTLCGFQTRDERDMFNKLINVSGVGAKVALIILNEYSTGQLIELKRLNNPTCLQKLSGIGPKLAEKIIQGLKI